jgi:hypothetical protein
VQPTSYQQAGTEMTAEQLSEAQDYFKELEKQADEAKWSYMACRVPSYPSYLQSLFLKEYPDPAMKDQPANMAKPPTSTLGAAHATGAAHPAHQTTHG